MNDANILDLAEINPPLKNTPAPEEIVGFIPMQSVREQGGLYDIKEAYFRDVSNGYTRFQDNDILFAKITPCMENGKGALVVNLPAGIGIGSTEFFVLRSRPKSDAGYVYQLMQWERTRIKAEAFMSGSAGQQRVLSVFFQRYKVFAPPRVFQARIARILQTVDQVIEKTEALIGKYQQIKTGLMLDLFTRGIGPEGQLRPPREQAPELYQETPIGWIPNEWEYKRLDSVATVERGKFTARPRNDPRYYGEGHPFIQTGDVTANLGRVLFTYSQSLNEKGVAISKSFPVSTIMVTIAANIADTCILGIRMYAPDSVVGVIADDIDDTEYLERCINRKKGWLYAIAPQSAQRNINLEDLRPLLVPWPRKEERLKIAEYHKTIERKICLYEIELEKLQKLKSGLMHDLLTGKVSVHVETESEPEAVHV